MIFTKKQLGKMICFYETNPIREFYNASLSANESTDPTTLAENSAANVEMRAKIVDFIARQRCAPYVLPSIASVQGRCVPDTAKLARNLNRTLSEMYASIAMAKLLNESAAIEGNTTLGNETTFANNSTSPAAGNDSTNATNVSAPPIAGNDSSSAESDSATKVDMRDPSLGGGFLKQAPTVRQLYQGIEAYERILAARSFLDEILMDILATWDIILA